jgi:hypothetical protein
VSDQGTSAIIDVMTTRCSAWMESQMVFRQVLIMRARWHNVNSSWQDGVYNNVIDELGVEFKLEGGFEVLMFELYVDLIWNLGAVAAFALRTLCSLIEITAVNCFVAGPPAVYQCTV